MNLDWHDWTYSNLWDLRYGRIYDDDPSRKREDIFVALMKLMLNTEFIEVTELPQGSALSSIKLSIEDGNYAKITFYSVNNKSYAVYDFNSLNTNPHLKLIAEYLKGKAVVINNEKMEKIVDIINR